jgi:Domain of Unknown Function (DUF748)
LLPTKSGTRMRNPVRGLGGWFRHHWLWFAVPVAAIVVLSIVVAFFVDEPLRRMTERQMNQKMKGYTAHIRKLDFHPIGFSVDFYDVQLVQNSNPDPPVMRIERLTASVQWRALLHRNVVADFKLVRPIVYVDKSHFETEMKDPTPVKDHGWQDALQAMYPLKINEFRITDGEATYVENAKAPPLKVTKIQASVRDIRNVRSAEGEYPSSFRLDAVVFDRGQVRLNGNADFLLEPYAGVKGHLEVRDVPLDYFAPVAANANVMLKRGAINGRGDIEYSPKIATVWLEHLRVDGLVADYNYTKADAGARKQVIRQGAQAAEQVNNARDVVIHIDDVRVVNATLGLINKSVSPEYRVFIDDLNLDLKKFSNQKDEGYGHAKATGRFLGSGTTLMDATFRPETKGPDFSLDARIENTDMRKMNDLLRAHAKFDVVSGVFSVFSELRVHDARIDGYVKPLFRDLKVYDKDKDADKTFGEKVKEKAIDVAAKVLKNRPRKEVATVADVSGRLENPQTSTWQVLIRLVQNAFIKAILPGFQREASQARNASD